MSGHVIKTRIAVSNCGCGGKGIAWQKNIPFTGRESVEVFCSKHCGIHIGPWPISKRGDGTRIVRRWNQAMSGGK